MRSLIQTAYTNDIYTIKQLVEAKECWDVNADKINKINRYDTVTLPIIGDNDKIIKIDISWVRVQFKATPQKFYDLFIGDLDLNCEKPK